MSRIGRAPIPLPKGVDIKISSDNHVVVKGPKGELSRTLHPAMQIVKEDEILQVKRPDDSKPNKALHGLTRSLLNNMVQGVTTGFTKGLEITGVGYRAAKVGEKIILQVGYSHPVEIDPPKGITLTTDSPTRINVTGIDKQLVGEIAAQIRSVRKPEPYKGKGIKYANEVIRRKAGKAGKVGGKKK